MTPNDHDPNTTAPWARALSFPAVLRDGRRARIRPITPTDKTRIVRAMDAMSARTRYLRFHAMRTGFTEPELRHLTELDYEQEARFTEIVHENFRDHPKIHVPRVLRDYTRREVICTTWFEGKKIIDPALLCPRTDLLSVVRNPVPAS